jgi:flagellar biosynthesis/type III secretory pathway protein FliH
MGTDTITIQMERAIDSVELGSGIDAAAASRKNPVNQISKQPASTNTGEAQQAGQNLMYLCKALDTAAFELKHIQQNMVKEHKEQIAKLAVEIARKVLMQEIKEGDYKIETIIKEALDNVPTLQDVEVHLNPEDFAQCQISEAGHDQENFKDVKLVPDPNVGKAECLIETPKGIIESVIEEHLDNISKALLNSE